MGQSETKLTNKFLKDLLKTHQKELTKSASPEMDLQQVWSQIVGAKMAQVTEVKSLNQGILVIKVASAPLSQLLSTTERPKILAKIKSDYPHLKIKNVVFRTG